MKISKLYTLILGALLLVCTQAMSQTNPGTSPLSIQKGGTAAATASAARSSLGLAIGSNVQAWSANLDAFSLKTAPAGAVVGTTDTQTLTNKTLPSPSITTPTGIVKGDVGLGNVDNTSDATKWAATKTFTNTTFNCSSTGNVCTVRLGSDVTGILPKTNGGLGATTLSSALDAEFSSAQGTILYRGSAGWAALAPGTAGQFLTTQGASANPNWSGGGAGTGTVTSVQCGPTITASGVCSQPYQPMNCSLGASNNGTLLTVNLLDGGGNSLSTASPCLAPFRSATQASGTWSVLVITSSISISTNAAGATLGSSNSSPFRLWVSVFNNSGTPVLALFNASTSTDVFSINEANLKSTTPMSASATSAGVFYTPNGTTLTNMPLKVLGYVEYASGLTTAGTYASNPTVIQTKGPGVQLPGSILSVSTVSTTTQTTASSATVATNLTKSLTLDSPVNLVELSSGGTMLTPANGSGSLRLYRGNAACTTAIGPDSAVSSTMTLPGLGALSWIDKPGTVSAAYTVCLTGAGGSALFPWSAFPNGTFTLKQIQG